MLFVDHESYVERLISQASDVQSPNSLTKKEKCTIVWIRCKGGYICKTQPCSMWTCFKLLVYSTGWRAIYGGMCNIARSCPCPKHGHAAQPSYTHWSPLLFPISVISCVLGLGSLDPSGLTESSISTMVGLELCLIKCSWREPMALRFCIILHSAQLKEELKPVTHPEHHLLR